MSRWIAWIDTSLPWRHPPLIPLHAGWYVRDWRGTKITPESERVPAIDLWTPVPDPRDILHPGVWYVVPDINDAAEQRLPWRVPTARELRIFASLYPREFAYVEGDLDPAA